ncbi:MAG: SpoIIE family protein phosphatase [Flavobacteriales bacterium]|nr:SpoIIE family protein phosphatase [Flavobacteriales bacterium]
MLDTAKSLFLSKNHQFLLLNEEGSLELSCNSLVNLDNWIGSSIYSNIPFFETIKIDIDQMSIGERQHYNCFSFPFNERQGTYDIVIQKESFDGVSRFICVIEDRTEQYKYWLSIQQERNVSQINEEIITKQSETIKQASKEITDSINYAKRIQRKILPSKERLDELFNIYFLIYKPKDIISGDFYWSKVIDKKLFLCIADATGHGVPGAIMSVIGNSLFTDAVSNIIDCTPAKILDYARAGIITTLKQNFEPDSQFDGMDAAMLSLDRTTNTLEYAGANNQLLIVTKNQDFLSVLDTSTDQVSEVHAIKQNGKNALFELSSDKIPIALYNGENKDFTNKRIQVEKGDRVYLFTDGFRDQFGGPRNKKIGYKRFKELIFDTTNLEIETQKDNLNIALETWRGHNEQIDDICVFGLEI